MAARRRQVGVRDRHHRAGRRRVPLQYGRMKE
jgi:hypothetical protein